MFWLRSGAKPWHRTIKTTLAKRSYSNSARHLSLATTSSSYQQSNVWKLTPLACVAALALGVFSPSNTTQSESEDTNNKPHRSVRLRRANTHLSKVDTILQTYEYQLRENSSLEKVFKYFTTLVVNDRCYMTPLDMVRSITPGVPPSSHSKPVNVPLHESSASQLSHFSSTEVPSFFKLAADDPGLISYGRFLIFITLLAIPANELETAYRMSCGQDFKTLKLRGDRLNVHNFDFIMMRNVKVRGQGYSTKHSKTSFVRHLFGKDLTGTLSFEQFQQFHLDLCTEVLKMEYFLLSDKERKVQATNNGAVTNVVGEPHEGTEPVMSLPAFARSVAALVPSDYRTSFLAKARALADEEIPAEFLRHRYSQRSGSNENNPSKGLRAKDFHVSLQEYSDWKEVLKQLSEMEHAIRKYSYADGHFTPTNLRRSGHAVTKRKLPQTMIWCLFYLFDDDNDGELHHDDFVRLLRPHAHSINPTIEPEGLGLDLFLKCTYKACRECFREWYDGTMDPDKADLSPVDEED